MRAWVRRGLALPALLVAGLAAGCGDPPPPDQRTINSKAEAERRGLSDEAIGTTGTSARDIFLGGAEEESGQNLRVNKYLWRGALDTLSFLPLASTDPFSGVIVTDWGTAQASPGERFKVSVYISSPALTAETLKVAVFREVQEGGTWVSAPVSAEVPRKIEDSILTRARQLRIADREAAAG
jgi:hypothetical protein